MSRIPDRKQAAAGTGPEPTPEPVSGPSGGVEGGTILVVLLIGSGLVLMVLKLIGVLG